MDKETFKIRLKHKGFTVDEHEQTPTVLFVGLSKDEFIKKRLEVLAFAKRCHYIHSVAVKNFEEVITDGTTEKDC